MSSITMLTLTMMNDNDVASKFKATILVLFLFGGINIVLIIRIWSNSKDPLFSTAQVNIKFLVKILMYIYIYTYGLRQ